MRRLFGNQSREARARIVSDLPNSELEHQRSKPGARVHKWCDQDGSVGIGYPEFTDSGDAIVLSRVGDESRLRGIVEEIAECAFDVWHALSD
jgi:hypothetical protein